MGVLWGFMSSWEIHREFALTRMISEEARKLDLEEFKNQNHWENVITQSSLLHFAKLVWNYGPKLEVLCGGIFKLPVKGRPWGFQRSHGCNHFISETKIKFLYGGQASDQSKANVRLFEVLCSRQVFFMGIIRASKNPSDLQPLQIGITQYLSLYVLP